MAKKKLEMVPAENLAQTSSAVALFQPAADVAIPKNAKKLTLPPLLKTELIPIGSVVSGRLIALVPSISSRPDMKDSKLLHLQHENGTEFLLGLTGVIKKALGGYDGAEGHIGQTIIVKRNPDGETEKYGGKKKVYQFDVYVAD